MRRFFGDRERMIDDLLRGWSPSSRAEEPAEWAPALDVRETNTDVIVDVEAPGLGPKDLDISIEDGTLTIRGERKTESEETHGKFRSCERDYGTFCRVVQMPAGVEVEKASATYDNGIVSISLPKTEKSRAKKITVG